MDEVLHQFETMGNHCLLVFTRESSFQWSNVGVSQIGHPQSWLVSVWVALNHHPRSSKQSCTFRETHQNMSCPSMSSLKSLRPGACLASSHNFHLHTYLLCVWAPLFIHVHSAQGRIDQFFRLAMPCFRLRHTAAS